MNPDIKLWEAREAAVVPSTATGAQIVQFAKQLSSRDMQQVTEAFHNGSYEMATAFIWTKTMSALKKQLASLGMEFIGEMLGRGDLSASSTIEQTITDYEAIRLAEDLGIATSTNALRLRHSFETIMHFAQREHTDDDDQMAQDEALVCLRACVQSILGHSKVTVAMRFAEFRQALENQVFNTDAEEMRNLYSSPSFFQKTTLNVLLALAKTATGAQLDNALANANVIIPLIWERLRKPERWQVGYAYAELVAEGRRAASSGLKKALLKVKGFDFVPENLRSSAFNSAAQKVLEAHDGLNNFYNEPAPMERLAELGSAIPMPAFKSTMTATVTVVLGNYYGHSFQAQSPAQRLLQTRSRDRWEYFLTECLPADRRILEKLLDSKPRSRWIQLVKDFSLADIKIQDAKMRRLVARSSTGDGAAVETLAMELIKALGYEG